MDTKTPYRTIVDFIIICGPPASGKMTVGQELNKLTGYPLFYNHLSLELVNQFFDFGTPHFRSLDKKIRFDIFEEVANSELPGLIFTLVWAFDDPRDEAYVDQIIGIFAPRNPQVCLVELKCELEERLKRNRHENRLAHKPSKRDVEASEKRLLTNEGGHRMNRLEGEFPAKAFLTIENTHLTAKEVAERIVGHYGLK